MTSFKVIVSKIDDEPKPGSEELEIFCQVIPESDFDLKRFVRDLNATPRKRRKAKIDLAT